MRDRFPHSRFVDGTCNPLFHLFLPQVLFLNFALHYNISNDSQSIILVEVSIQN